MRVLAVALALLLVLVHGWVGARSLVDGTWWIAVRLGLHHPIPWSQAAEIALYDAHESGFVLGAFAMTGGAARVAAASCLLGGLAAWLGAGRRLALVSGAAAAWVLHAVDAVLSVCLGFLRWERDDVLFSLWLYESGWADQDALWMRFPAALAATIAGLSLSAAATAAIAACSRPAPTASA